MRTQCSGDWARVHREKWTYRIPESSINYDHFVNRARSFAREYDVPFDQAFPSWKLEGLRQLIQVVNKPKTKVRRERFGDLAFDFTRVLATMQHLSPNGGAIRRLLNKKLFGPSSLSGSTGLVRHSCIGYCLVTRDSGHCKGMNMWSPSSL